MEKYTIIIPVRDRAETIGATIKTCLRQNYDNLEIIVSDNCSTDGTRDVILGFHDRRITYLHTGHRLSMSGNFEYALSHVTEGFVMFIGSDDGIMPDAVDYVNSIVRRYKVDAVSCRQATYIWPDFFDRNVAGALSFGGWRDDVEIRSSDYWIRKTLNFDVSYCFELPNLYCGFVHKRVIDKAFKNGRFFYSLTPDAYAALAAAIFVDKYAFSHRPFSIAGASSKSNGASALNASGDGVEAKKFLSENDIDFAPGFINCPSFEIILGESFAKLKEIFPEECSPYEINYSAMLGRALINANQKTRAEVAKAVQAMGKTFDVPNVLEMRNLNLRGKNAADISRLIKNLLLPSKFVAIPQSSRIGVRDIDDASLVAHVLSQNREKFITNKQLFIQLLKKLFGR